ncbi:MAG: glutathione-disulfide reductase [Burkholderiales bacterium]|nr:glutathione-disulfide reductase [Burkholderiales bacterium]
MTTPKDFDFFVIGAGSGGVRASRVAASSGAKVAVAESYRAGGTCVIRGCVPKKLLVYAAHFHEDFEDAAGYGWSVPQAEFSWPRLIEAKNREIARLEGIYENLLAKAGVNFMRGRARVVDAHTVEVEGKRHTARHILVATGGWPVKPDIPGAELGISSNEAFELTEMPRRVLMVGGGYIAVEFAGIFRGLGAEVTLSYRGSEILRGFDDDVRAHLRGQIEAKGIRVLLRNELTSIERHGGALRVRTSDVDISVDCDCVMFATGRMPNTAGLGLAEAGVALDENGAVIVDQYGQSSVPSIHAVGDVTHRVQLTPVAIREGQALANTLFNNRPTSVSHANIPSAVFSQPPIGTVGDSEEAAIQKYGRVEVYQAKFRPMKHTLSGRSEQTYMKLIVEPKSQKVVGVHMVGPDAPEIIQGIGIAVVAGLTKQQFDDTMAIHPTAAEEFVTMREKVLRGF